MLPAGIVLAFFPETNLKTRRGVMSRVGLIAKFGPDPWATSAIVDMVNATMRIEGFNLIHA